MGNKVNLINEIYNRLSTAIGVDGLLYGVKQVRVGTIEETRKENDLPIINIRLLSGEEEANYPNRQARDDMRVEVILVANKLGQVGNSLFKTGDSTGALFLLEKILNVIDKNTSGTVDNTLNSTADFIIGYSYDISEENSEVVIRVVVKTKSKSFSLGGR